MQPVVQRSGALTGIILVTWGGLAGADAIVKGFVANGPTTPVPDQTVLLVTADGEIAQQSSTGWTGGFKFREVAPGTYYLVTGDHAIAIEVADRNVRQDFDLSAPDGRLSYVDNAAAEFVTLLRNASQPGKGGAGAKRPGSASGAGGVLPSPDGNAQGTTDCWASAGCDGYDGATDSYEMSDSGSYDSGVSVE